MLAAALGLRPASAADLPLMIEAAAQSAWSTDAASRSPPASIAALRAEKMILPAPAVIERAGIAGRARARKRAADALLAGLSEAQTRPSSTNCWSSIRRSKATPLRLAAECPEPRRRRITCGRLIDTARVLCATSALVRGCRDADP